jgi:hypothetical protein
LAKKNFVVLIGGPGKFESCDREHDLTWTNYIVPIQIALQEKQVALDADEQIHWWVYAPAYRERWQDDTDDVAKKKNPGPELLESRKKAIDKVKTSGASDYLDRIKRIADTLGASFLALERPQEFWDSLQKLPDRSVSRLWYFGHAAGRGLMLKLSHDKSCGPVADPADMIYVADIQKKSGTLANKLITNGKPSKFYGCYTKAFAEQWNNYFHAAAEGAVNKIDFGVTDQPSKEQQILRRLERSNTDTGWTAHPIRP